MQIETGPGYPRCFCPHLKAGTFDRLYHDTVFPFNRGCLHRYAHQINQQDFAGHIWKKKIATYQYKHTFYHKSFFGSPAATSNHTLSPLCIAL